MVSMNSGKLWQSKQATSNYFESQLPEKTEPLAHLYLVLRYILVHPITSKQQAKYRGKPSPNWFALVHFQVHSKVVENSSVHIAFVVPDLNWEQPLK